MSNLILEFTHLFTPRRFREVPTYGLDTIRKFSNNVSAMKKLGARDFEDILQVSLQPPDASESFHRGHLVTVHHPSNGRSSIREG